MTLRAWVYSAVSVLAGCGGVIDTAHLEVREDQAYIADANPKHQVDLYLPRPPRAAVPIAAFIHGGSWKEQDRRFHQWLTGFYGQTGAALARLGWATAVVGYRQLPEAPHEESARDVARAIAWLEGHAAELGGDPRCVVVLGHSGGGLLAAHVAWDPSMLRAAGGDPTGIRGVALLSGVYDVEALISFASGGDREGMTRVYGADANARARWNALRFVRPDLPPTLVLVGGDEPEGLRAEERTVVAALGAARAPVEAATLLDQGHMDTVPERDNAALARITPWLATIAAGCRARR